MGTTAATNVAGVLCCPDCEAALEIVCPRGHADAADRAFVAGRKPSALKGRPAGARSYRPKPCARCARDFSPTGPRAIYCARPDCQERPS
jgi:hypothetical protein